MSEQIERRRGTTWALTAMVCLATSLSLAGCNKASHDNVEKWRNTEEGPGRLEKAVKNTDLDMDVRAHAAEALISLDQVDKVVAAVGTMSPEQRNFFFEKLTPRLWTVAKVVEADQAPTGKQIRAKDGMFELRSFAEGQRRKDLDDNLLDWLTVGGFYDERAALGQHQGSKIVRNIGVRGGPKMVQLGQDKLKALDQGQKGIVPISRDTLEGIAYTGAPEAVGFLLEVGEQPQVQEGLQVQAMTALYNVYIIDVEQPRPDILGLVPYLDRLKKMAFSEDMPGENVNIAYELIAAVPSPACLQPLVYLATHREFILRLRAIDFAMRCGGAEAIVPLAEALPDGDYQQAIIDKYFVKKIPPEATPNAAEAAKTLLGSRSWVARFIGLEILAATGKKGDAGAARALAGDKTKLKGFWGRQDSAKPPKAEPTMGQRAGQVAEMLEKKS